MSEQLKPNHERSGEKLDLAAEAKKNLERIHKEAEKSSEELSTEKIEQAVETEAISGKEFSVGDQKEAGSQQPIPGAQQELKADAYKQTLKSVQKELKPADRSFSKFIHRPSVETVSNISAQTVARPSALLGGGLAALLGSSFALYMSKHYGFRYSTFVAFILFFGGFIVGIAVEFAVRLFTKKRAN